MKEYRMRYPNGLVKALTFSYDDAVEQDQKLVSILNQYGMKGTFNINTGLFSPEGTTFPAGTIHRRMTQSQTIALLKDSGHEIAVHCLTHPFLEQLPANAATMEVLGDRANIERLFGGIVRGMAYPYGTYNDEIVAMLRSAGILYSRTVNSSEQFYLPQDWLRLPPTCHHDNPHLMELADRFLASDPQSCELFYLWGHSYEFEANNNWEVIENFAAKMAHNDTIWYATNLEIFSYVEAYKQLQFNTDMTLAYNPTATTLYMQCDDTIYSIAPGQTLQF